MNTSYVAVTNPGEAIPPEQLNQIWERYQRAQHQGGHKESMGTGIGLAIVSMILTAHGFAYGADSAAEMNCFWFAIDDPHQQSCGNNHSNMG